MSTTREHLIQIETYLKNELVPHVESLLQEWQRNQVAGQERLNLMWNTMNVFLKMLLDKGVVTEEEFTATGRLLAEQAHRNFEAVKRATRAGQMPTRELEKTPLEKLQAVLSTVTQEVRKAIAADEAAESMNQEFEGGGTL